MKIRVVGQIWYRKFRWSNSSVPVYEQPDSEFWSRHNFITIRNSFQTEAECAVPVSGANILKLCFDDATADPEGTLILFDESIAQQIVVFLRQIDRQRPLFINCAAGVSRSGAVGEVLNDYFNRFLESNEADDADFREHNRQICGNPLVRRLLSRVLFDAAPAPKQGGLSS